MSPPRDGLERQFPHLQQDAAAKPGLWRSPALAVTATVLAVGLGAALVPVSRQARDFRQEAAGEREDSYAAIGWAALVPRHWDVSTEVRDLQARQAGVADNDPRARASLGRLRELFDQAPTEPSLDGRRVRLPGYVVPLDGQGGREFLLVPYFGACIHTPPPPANQVVHVVADRHGPTWKAMDAVWVRGTLSIATHTSAAAVSGYRLTAVSVEPHTTPRGREVHP